MTDADVMALSIRLAMAFHTAQAELIGGMSRQHITNAVVALMGVTVMFICACRMGRMTKKHQWDSRLGYTGLFTGSFCLAFAPFLFGHENVRYGAALFAASVIAHLLVLGREWLRGQPPTSMEDCLGPKSDPAK